MIGWLWFGAAFAIDLDEARAHSTTRAIGVIRQQAVLDSAKSLALSALSDNLPQIGAFAQGSVVSGPNPFGRFTSRQISVGVSGAWRLVDPVTWRAAGAARSSRRGEEALLAWSRAMARRDATARFADAVAAVEVADAFRTAETDAQRAAEGIHSLADAGLRPLADAAQADAVAASLTADRVAAEGEIGATCAALQAQMGVPIDGHCDLVPFDAWPEPSSTDARHPALVAAEEVLNAAQRVRQASVLGYAPALVATGEVAQNVGTAVVGDNPDDARDLSGLSLSAGLRAEMPLVGSGAGVARVKQATANRTAAEVSLDEQQRLLTSGLVAAEARYAAALAAVDANVRALVAAREALVLVEARYEQGLADLPTFIEARRARDRALVARAQARAELGGALAELEANRGISE